MTQNLKHNFKNVLFQCFTVFGLKIRLTEKRKNNSNSLVGNIFRFSVDTLFIFLNFNAWSERLQLTVYLQNFGRTQVNSTFSCYLASAIGWKFSNSPAILATLPVRWLLFHLKLNFKYFWSSATGGRVLNPSLRKYFSLFATEFTGRRFYSIFEALSLSLNEVITRQILSTKNCQQAFCELLLNVAIVTEANS